jgi:hypothetical protein
MDKCFLKKCENEPKSTITMGYSPCFLAKMSQMEEFKGIK